MPVTYRSYNPEQRVLFPSLMPDSLPANHLAFFVLDMLSKLDLSAIHSAYEARKGGQPPYHPDAGPRERMLCKLSSASGKAVYKMRKAIVEPVFGQIKDCRGFRRFSMRGFANAGHEWSFVCTVHNLL